jgi:hypothetical protein
MLGLDIDPVVGRRRYSTFLFYCLAVLCTSLSPSPLAIFLVWSVSAAS